VAIQKPVNRRGGHLLAQLVLVSLLDLRHRQHPARLGTLDEGRQKLLLLLGAEVLVMPAAAPAQIEDGISLLRPARVQDMHRRSGPAHNSAICAAELPRVARMSTHWMRWYSA